VLNCILRGSDTRQPVKLRRLHFITHALYTPTVSAYSVQATYTVLSGGGLLGRLDSLHSLQLCSQSLRYVSSLSMTASAALAQRSLGSLQPASLHNFEMKLQQSRTSFLLSTALLVRTRRQSSLANTHVLMCLNCSSTRLRAL